MGPPSGCENPPEGAETGAQQGVSGKDLLPLDLRSDFWEARDCSDHEIPTSALRRNIKPAPYKAGFVLLGFGFSFENCSRERGRNRRALQNLRLIWP